MAAALRNVVAQQEAERARTARDLHDSLGQHTAMPHLKLDEIDRGDNDTTTVPACVAKLECTATDLSHAIGRLAWELRPVALNQLGLRAAIQTYTEAIAADHGIMFDLHLNLGDRRLDTAVETTTYSAVQEGVTKIVKHADPRHVGIALDVHGSEKKLIIEDDGQGFTCKGTETSVTTVSGLGLLGMRDRLALVGSTLEIGTTYGKGCALLVRVPV